MKTRDIIFQKLKESKKYKYVCDDTLRRMSQWAVERYNAKTAVKAAKNKLHQVYGAYLEKMNISKIQKRLDQLSGNTDPGSLETTALKIMGYHASTSERLPFMDQFYSDLFSRIGKPGKILDLACGLNPFAVFRMALGPETEYIACDIDMRLIAFINTFFNYLKRPYKAQCLDILCSLPETEPEADVVFILKTLPCLEQQEKGAGERILKALKAKHVVISFPSKSLTGKEKGMANYFDRFILDILERLSLDHFKLEYPNEVFYVAQKVPPEFF
jgi:16S rRNA (guanine(1405)-N(7))-methyltransferase